MNSDQIFIVNHVFIISHFWIFRFTSWRLFFELHKFYCFKPLFCRSALYYTNFRYFAPITFVLYFLSAFHVHKKKIFFYFDFKLHVFRLIRKFGLTTRSYLIRYWRKSIKKFIYSGFVDLRLVYFASVTYPFRIHHSYWKLKMRTVKIISIKPIVYIML